MKWNPQFTSPEWKKTVTFYLDLIMAMARGRIGNGLSENLALFPTGQCAMWIDADLGGLPCGGSA